MAYDEKADAWLPTSWAPSKAADSPNAAAPPPAAAAGAEKSKAQDEAAKAALQAVMNTLNGDMGVVPLDGVIELQSGDTIVASGLGKYLSGRYFVKSVKRSITGGGYAQTLNVVKTGFGDYVKLEENVDGPPPSEEARQTPGIAKK
jgi:hypothetical protein